MFKNIDWFKKSIAPNLEGYEILYKFFENGDFGSLNQVEFNSEKMGGVIDFWSTGWLGIHLIDYLKEDELLNVFFEPNQNSEKEKAWEDLQDFLK